MDHPNLSRRHLIGGVLAASAASYPAALGANDRLRVANIGCGRRGLLKELIQVKDNANIEIAAVCDTWRQKREKAAADVKEFTGKDPFQTAHFAEVLSRKDIDAVVIGTPDHLHCSMLIDAIKAGKDVYVEKPLAMNMRELIRAYDIVKRSDRIVQVGTQMRSYPNSVGAKKAIAAGELGKILKVEQVRNGYSPYWISFGGDTFQSQKPTEADVDWKAFLGDRKARPFDAAQYQGWYGFRDFSRGPHTNLMVHFIDMVHFATGTGPPSRVVALGGIYRWKNEFTNPDSVEVALEYPEGFMVRYCTVFGTGAGNYAKWFGTRGTLDAKNLSPTQKWVLSGQGSGEPDRVVADMEIMPVETVRHMQNFLDSVRTRQQPIAPIEAGYAHSVAVIMADEALTAGRRMVYDSAKREVHAG
ncbi:MAG TPA: Gfo/Idh/MocA family oxidoreductase [Bryobacteraceae bacterium]|nr:Gfo/Idh/MocA family oxidoreductase [Bryobacteraceae bacterium]